MKLTYEEVMQRLAERTVDNTRQLKRALRQRRNGMEDLYGIPFHANGDANMPATFYISLSPDYVYLEQLALKLVIQPYESSIGSVDLSEVTVDPTRLTVGSDDDITPNPHSHTLGGQANLGYGIKRISTASADWRVDVAGINITAYLIEQHDGEWIDGEGIYPNESLGADGFYDLLGVASMMTAEGKTEEREQILAPEFKKVQIYSNQPFGVTAYLYTKYPHSNR